MMMMMMMMLIMIVIIITFSFPPPHHPYTIRRILPEKNGSRGGESYALLINW